MHSPYWFRSLSLSPHVRGSPVIWIVVVLWSGHSLLTLSHACNCLVVPETLTCCRRKFPFPWEGGIHLQTPTRPPVETSPLMTTTPPCCLSAPCWLCKRTGPRGARRSFIKCQSSICWWAICRRQSQSQGKVLLDQGLEKVTGAWWVLGKPNVSPFVTVSDNGGSECMLRAATCIPNWSLFPPTSKELYVFWLVGLGCICLSKMSLNYHCHFYKENKLSLPHHKTACQKQIVSASNDMSTQLRVRNLLCHFQLVRSQMNNWAWQRSVSTCYGD
jgi:hypothetical protein